MANKRQLKKEINYITEELISECLYNRYFITDCDAQKNDEILAKIISMQDEFLRRVNVTDGKNNPKIVKKYYQNLIASFDLCPVNHQSDVFSLLLHNIYQLLFHTGRKKW